MFFTITIEEESSVNKIRETQYVKPEIININVGGLTKGADSGTLGNFHGEPLRDKLIYNFLNIIIIIIFINQSFLSACS